MKGIKISAMRLGALGLVMACSFLGACGFQPLYVQREKVGGWYFNSEFDTTILDEMKQIKVEPIAERFGQLVRNHLLDALTPTGVPKKPKYRLFVTLQSRNVYQQALREDVTATREMIVFKVDYRMTEGSKQLFAGDSVAYVSYDILKNPYSTTVSQLKAEKNAARIIADDITLRIGAYFHSVESKRGVISDL